jgi:hypothetical protein
MRLNEVDVCNHAIGLCGSTDWIQSLTDASVSAKRCSRFLMASAERVLRKHDWSCATRVAKLARNTTNVLNSENLEYEYSYALPFDSVRVIGVYGDSTCYSPYDRWKVIGRNINTNLDAVYLKYVAMPEDFKELDILLSTAIAYEMALMLCPTLVKDPNALPLLFQGAKFALREACAIDTLENKELYTENNPWSDARMIAGG